MPNKNFSYHKKKSRRSVQKRVWVPVVCVLVLGGTLAVLELTNTTHLLHKKPSSSAVTRAGHFSPSTSPTSTTPSAAPKKPVSNTQRTIGGGTDTKGGSSPSTSPSQWITSKSGAITVKSPIANATLQNGATLSGTAKVHTVNFRLVDNSAGVIAEGTLAVVNGKFSGKLGFSPHSSTGQLDVFSTTADGNEINEIQIAVKF